MVLGDVPRSTHELEPFLRESIDEADADLWVFDDVSDADRRGDVRDDQVVAVERREDLLR